jgi:glucose-6-phosphate-specific signal transduction histidine kinase
VDVEICWSAAAVEIHSSNAVPKTNGYVARRGLTGMRHRAELLGGSFTVRADDGRFEVRVRIPIGEHT